MLKCIRYARSEREIHAYPWPAINLPSFDCIKSLASLLLALDVLMPYVFPLTLNKKVSSFRSHDLRIALTPLFDQSQYFVKA